MASHGRKNLNSRPCDVISSDSFMKDQMRRLSLEDSTGTLAEGTERCDSSLGRSLSETSPSKSDATSSSDGDIFNIEPDPELDLAVSSLTACMEETSLRIKDLNEFLSNIVEERELYRGLVESLLRGMELDRASIKEHFQNNLDDKGELFHLMGILNVRGVIEAAERDLLVFTWPPNYTDEAELRKDIWRTALKKDQKLREYFSRFRRVKLEDIPEVIAEVVQIADQTTSSNRRQTFIRTFGTALFVIDSAVLNFSQQCVMYAICTRLGVPFLLGRYGGWRDDFATDNKLILELDKVWKGEPFENLQAEIAQFEAKADKSVREITVSEVLFQDLCSSGEIHPDTRRCLENLMDLFKKEMDRFYEAKLAVSPESDALMSLAERISASSKELSTAICRARGELNLHHLIDSTLKYHMRENGHPLVTGNDDVRRNWEACFKASDRLRAKLIGTGLKMADVPKLLQDIYYASIGFEGQLGNVDLLKPGLVIHKEIIPNGKMRKLLAEFAADAKLLCIID